MVVHEDGVDVPEAVAPGRQLDLAGAALVPAGALRPLTVLPTLPSLAEVTQPAVPPPGCDAPPPSSPPPAPPIAGPRLPAPASPWRPRPGDGGGWRCAGAE